ncbi:hypothetical protein [Bradyrhizobium sp. SZCCHNR1075]|uniref:hypothetical protein n=1 Tax=Bradyrhizobium sp. SZCCHNR1075 TaxID=3057362 RepID=UPI0028E83890|nr:hypothetical protein [Bradyrhizobium sp. SZCCHNR1075]
MAWQFIGFMNGRDEVKGTYRKGTIKGGTPAIYGPLPIKRWIKRIGERKWRMTYRPSKLVTAAKDGLRAKEVTSRMAGEYAQWLAKRNGITIPADAVPQVVWSQVGNDPKDVRVSAVNYHEKGHGRWGHSTKHILTIDIPHWDWTPADPIEETLQSDLLAA